MASTCYGQQRNDLPDLDTFAPGADDVDPGLRGPNGALPAPASAGLAAPTEEPRLAIERMKVSIEDGLVMVFGPDGDPVPPQAVVRAAAEQPAAVVALPDGTAVVARRLAMVLQAQTLGRLGAAEHGDGWIMTMLQGRDWPGTASDKDLTSEQEPGVLEGRVERLKIATASGSYLIADVGPEGIGEAMGLSLPDGTPISVVGLVSLLRGPRVESRRTIDAPEKALAPDGDIRAGDDPASLDLSGCAVEFDADGVWFDSPILAVVGGRVRLARWATRAPDGPVVAVLQADGGIASLRDLCAALGMARDVAVDHDPPSEMSDAAGSPDHESSGTPGPEATRHVPRQKPDDASGWTAPDIALTVPEFPRLDLDSASVAIAEESALDLSFLDVVDAGSAPTLDGMITDLPEDALLSAVVDQSHGGGTLANDLSDRSSLDPSDSADGFAGVTGRRAENGGSPSTVVGAATEEAPSAAPAPQVSPERTDEIDPDSIVLVMVRGVPDGARLSAGIRNDDGSWSLSPLDLPSVTIMPGEGSSDDAGSAFDGELIITGIALTEDGALAALSETVPLADYLSDPAPGETVVEPAPGAALAASGDCSAGPRPSTIALEVDPRIWDGEEFDALVIRDLPAGAGLSAGACDPTIDGWVLMPQDLSGLMISLPAGQAADFTLTLMGVVLRPGDTNAARVLARLPVALQPLPESPTAHRRDR